MELVQSNEEQQILGDDVLAIEANELIVEEELKQLYLPGVIYPSIVRKISTRGFQYDEIQPSGNTRIRSVASDNNAFGLLAGKTCPGITNFCKGCYAENSQIMPGVKEKMRHNTEQLLNATSVDEMEDMLTGMVGQYYEGAKARDTPANDLIFRIHWDGDFFSVDYAEAWARTVQSFPDITFLAFTRSIGYGPNPINVLPALSRIENLVLYLSLDEDNAEKGQAEYEKWQPVYGARLRRAWCAEGYDFARELANKYTVANDLKPRECPENNRSLPLMKETRDKAIRGACTICKMCFNGTRDVLFAKTGKQIVSVQQTLEIVPDPNDTSQSVLMGPTRKRNTSAQEVEILQLFKDAATLTTQEALFTDIF